MRKIIFLFLITAFKFSASAWGQEGILGPEPTETNPPHTAPADNSNLKLIAGGGVGGAGYSLVSRGYNASLPMSLSYLWNVSGSYQFNESRFSISLEYSEQRTVFENIRGVTPYTVNVNNSFYNGLVYFDLTANWQVGAGIGFKQRLATRTSPQDTISSAIASGSIAAAT